MPGDRLLYLDDDYLSRLNNYEYNPTLANQILDDLGFAKGDDGVRVTPNGTRLEFDMGYPAGWGTLIVEYIQGKLMDIGIKANLVTPPFTEWWDDIRVWTYPILGIAEPYARHPSIAFRSLYLPQPVGSVSWEQLSGLPPGKLHIGKHQQVVDVPEWLGGGTMNVTALTEELQEPLPFERTKEIVRLLAWHANEYLPYFPSHHWGNMWTVNLETVDGWENYPDDHPMWFWHNWNYYIGMMQEGKLVPKVEEEPTVITYLTVWAVETIAKFTGLDNLVYGPIDVGSGLSIPSGDAERLVTEGKASYSPPLPAGLEETVDSTYQAVQGLQTSISSIDSSITSLSATINTLSTILYAIAGLQIIVLIVVVVIVLRKD
jgi:hypothetical protein